MHILKKNVIHSCENIKICILQVKLNVLCLFHCSINLSPTQMLMKRRTQTQLPVNDKLLNPQYDGEKIQNALKEKRHTQKHYYDREAKPLQQLNPDDQI